MPAASRSRSKIAPAAHPAATPGGDATSYRRGPQRPEFSELFSTFRASFPQIYGNVDRVKAKQQNVAVTDVFQALQVYLGGLYINDFNYLGRTWHVMAQADAPFRATAAQVSLSEDAQRRRTDGAAGRGHGPQGHRRPGPHPAIRPL